ncbi:hypothetical protein GCM10023116_31090 [Kistimonas scapharcae]|uniref:Conjugal transfer protein TraR n=1 Tax=Kistimonas scapharcae TaxID=1036133 RepID=A0ABP8V6B4_9GAMM
MGDQFDQAQALDQLLNDVALANHFSRVERVRPLVIDGELCCVACEEPIEPERLGTAVTPGRCIICQQRHEREVRRYG